VKIIFVGTRFEKLVWLSASGMQVEEIEEFVYGGKDDASGNCR